MINHILLELYCLRGNDSNPDTIRPSCCPSAAGVPTYACLINECPNLDYTTCENTLCYINETSEMEAGISLGGEMIDNRDYDASLIQWKEISLKSIDAAYRQYMDSSHSERIDK